MAQNTFIDQIFGEEIPVLNAACMDCTPLIKLASCNYTVLNIFANIQLREGTMSVDVQLTNVVVNGDMIEGDIQIKADILGLSLDKTQHFKTKKDVEQVIDLGNGIELKLLGTLEPPNKACVSGRISAGFVGVDIPKQCVTV